MVDSIYDEVIKLNSLKGKEEIEKYFIPEEFSDLEIISHILKKGENVQKMALIHNIPKYIKNKEISEFLFSNLIEYIEIWEENLQIEFANSILHIFKTYSYKLYIENLRTTYNLIIKFCMKIISTDDKNICHYYINALNQIVSFFNLYGKTRIENDIIDFSLNLGNFGKPSISKRYSVYFCSCILQISEVLNNEIINRFMILSSDTDKLVRQEIAYHMRFLCLELEESYIRKNVLKVIDNYLNDSDLIIRTSIISSILSTIPNKINDDFIIVNCVNKIQYIFDTESLNTDIQRTQITIFRCLIKEINRFGTFEKYFNSLIKFFLTKHILSKDKNYDFILPLDFLIEELPQIINFYKILEINTVHEIINIITYYIFDHCAKQSREDHIFQHAFKDLSLNFITSLPKLIKEIPKSIFNIYITQRIFVIFSYPIVLKESIVRFLSLLSVILEAEIKNENDEFLQMFITNYTQIENFFKFDTDYKDLNLLLSSIQKGGIRLFQNEEFNNKIFHLIKRLIKEENLQVKIECLKIMVRLIKYSNKTMKEEVLKFIDLEIVNSKSFYTKRLFFFLFEECLGILSLTFIKEKNLLDNLLKLLNENNIYFINKVLSYLPSIYYCIFDDSKLKNLINARIETAKNTYSKDLITSQTIKRTEEFILKFCKEYNYEENQRILANDKNKFDQEIIPLMKENNEYNTINIDKKKNPQMEIEEFMKKRGLNRKLIKKTSINNIGSIIKSEVASKQNFVQFKPNNIIFKKTSNQASKSEKKEIPPIINYKNSFLTVTSSHHSPSNDTTRYVKNSNSSSHIDQISNKTNISIEKNIKHDRDKSTEKLNNISYKSKVINNINPISNYKYQTKKLLKYK